MEIFERHFEQPNIEPAAPQASNKELLILVGLFTLCIFAIGNLYRSYQNTQNPVMTDERISAIGTNQKLQPKHAPEIGY